MHLALAIGTLALRHPCPHHPPTMVTHAGMVRSFFAACAFLLSIALTLLVSLDMFYTCRFYHYPTESATAIVAGLALFQVPVLIWLSHVRRSQ